MVQVRRVHLCTPTGALTQQFPREPPLSNMGAKVKNDANVPEVPYATRVWTSGVRPNPTKEEKLLRNGAEKLPPDEFVKLLPELADRGLFRPRRGDERSHPPTAPGAIAELARLRASRRRGCGRSQDFPANSCRMKNRRAPSARSGSSLQSARPLNRGLAMAGACISSLAQRPGGAQAYARTPRLRGHVATLYTAMAEGGGEGSRIPAWALRVSALQSMNAPGSVTLRAPQQATSAQATTEADEDGTSSSSEEDDGSVTSSASMLQGIPSMRLSQCVEAVEQMFDCAYLSELSQWLTQPVVAAYPGQAHCEDH